MGKIALIDLERFELNKTKSNRNLDDFIDRLVTLFPFQADLIMEEVKVLFPGRALSCEKHRSAEKRVLDFFERVYSSHKAFLHSKNISPENPKGGQISQDETDKIILETESDPFKVESIIKRLNETISSIDSGLAWQTLLSKRSPHLSFEDMDIRVLKTLQKKGHIHAYFSFSGSVIVHL